MSWVVLKSFYPMTCIIGLCWHHFIWQLILFSGAHIILSDNSHCSVMPTSFYPTTHTVQWCPHHFIQQLMLLGCADIIFLTICIKIHFDVLCDSRQHNAPYYANLPSVSTHMFTIQCIAVNKVICLYPMYLKKALKMFSFSLQELFITCQIWTS